MVIWFLILEFFLTNLQPTKVKRSECPKSNNHHAVMYFEKAVTSKLKQIENRGWSYFVAPLKFFLLIIWFLLFKFFLTKLLPTKVKRTECPKSNNNLQNQKFIQHIANVIAMLEYRERLALCQYVCGNIFHNL